MKIEWYQLGIVFLLLVSGIICNTQNEDAPIWGSSPTEWYFLDNECLISAKEVGVVEAQKIYKDVKIKLGEDIIYENDKIMLFNHFGILPIVRKLDNSNIEVLMGIKAPEIDKIKRLIFDNNEIVVNDTLPLFSGNHKNIDDDNFVEFAGFLNKFESYCSNCDSAYYNPLLYYEMHPMGFKLDTTATLKWIESHYEQNLGFLPDKTKIVRLKKKTVSS